MRLYATCATACSEEQEYEYSWCWHSLRDIYSEASSHPARGKKVDNAPRGCDLNAVLGDW